MGQGTGQGRRLGEQPSPRGPVRRRLFPGTTRLLLVLALIAAGCSGRDGVTAPVPDGVLTLDVRVHLLRSDAVPELDATLTDEEVGLLFGEVTAIWQQAEIAWRVESILREEARNAAEFAQALRGEALLLPALLSVLPTEQLTDGGWDVFLIRDLGGRIVGAYLSNLPAVVAPEIVPPSGRDLTGATARAVAHELGHSLGLIHVPCTEAGNLMAQGCAVEDRRGLEPFQIEAAREQAARGMPF
ncbi:MAG: hypothetical protein ACE5JR_13270 [Gemmatimonadota bacterium]